MKFPPPFRYLVPLLLLGMGLITAWLDYELDLANDLDRHFNEITLQAEATGRRLAIITQKHLDNDETNLLRESLNAWRDEPALRIIAVVRGDGKIIAATEPSLDGLAAADSPVSIAWEKAQTADSKNLRVEFLTEGDIMVNAAFPVSTKHHGQHWILLIYNRSDAIAQAHLDARRQFTWFAAMITFFCLCIWAVLYLGVAIRLARLSSSVRDFGLGLKTSIQTISGGDEVHELSKAFAEMGQRLIEREQEQMKLEREVIDSTENERSRIGHELHDSIGQKLTAVLMTANALHEALRLDVPELSVKTEILTQQLRESLTEVRGLSHGLAPVPLWEHGLEHALQELADSTFQSTGIRCVFECGITLPTCPETVAGNLYRIAQEAVGNALKHASAQEIRIGLEYHEGSLVLEVDDDGVGLPEATPSKSGIGFRVMRHRATMIAGKFGAGAPPAGGTRISIHIPIKP